MKKYLIFGLISGAIVSALYPLYYTLLSFSVYYGLSDNMVRILTFMIYVIVAMIIWKKQKPEFKIRNLFMLILGCIIGMFGMIGFQWLYMYIDMYMGIKTGFSLKIWSPLALFIVLKPAFDFGNVYIIIKYISQLIMQIVPYIAVCKINKVIKNKKFIKTGEQ